MLLRLLLFIILFPLPVTQTIFDFKKDADLQKWVIVNDVVMGGRSEASISLDPEGNGVYEGLVSLKNNGGFSSLRYNAPRTAIGEHSKVYLRLRGDAKAYQFRMKADREDRHAYVFRFPTTGEWQEIEIPLKDLHPTFRGRKLDMPNFENTHFEEIAFLIGNKKQEAFKLLIDKIELR